MSDALIRAFDEAWAAVSAGERLEAVLARYPDLADELRPMLLAAQAAVAQPERARPAAQTASRQRMLARARALRETRHTGLFAWLWPQPGQRRLWALQVAALTFVAVVFVGGGAAVSASATAVPGDLLYPFKRTIENVQLSVSNNDQALQDLFDQRRREETQRVLNEGRAIDVSFSGTVSMIMGERWRVGDFTVTVRPPLGEGLTVGDRVRVTARSDGAGALVATRLERLQRGETPTAEPRPTNTVLPTLTQTSAPTVTPDWPAASATPRPTQTTAATGESGDDAETQTPEAAETERPTRTPRPDNSGPPASRTPEPARTDRPRNDGSSSSATPEPARTDDRGGQRPTEPPRTPEPSRTEKPTRTEEPTETEEPDDDGSSGGGGGGRGGGSGPSPSNTPRP